MWVMIVAPSVSELSIIIATNSGQTVSKKVCNQTATSHLHCVNLVEYFCGYSELLQLSCSQVRRSLVFLQGQPYLRLINNPLSQPEEIFAALSIGNP